ncbi:MAG: UDP-4-amino-4,6-dideoxy-N-acetyl-beta-L-altrosamine transaminase [Spirochaetes bacterium]|nr:MAG: UDP-4-amino-4,6-dideoxy-N-acetyl-beta-L-altrosamine transaminase [Spirochaetota bacterium]
MNRNIKPIPFFKPSMGRAEWKAARKVIKSGWLTTGPEALAFEKAFAEFLMDSDSPEKDELNTLSVNSATAGLHLALEAVGIGSGSLVAVPTMTFTATAEIIRYLGGNPVFIDSDETTGNMNPAALEKAVNAAEESGKKIKAVIPVHLAGYPCDIKAVRKALGGSDAAIVEDAAHAFPSRTGKGMAGTLGDIGVFSFYATKTITTGEGGMVVTRNKKYEKRMRLMRLHGIDRVVWNRYAADSAVNSWEYDVTAPGFKYNMPDLSAAIGHVQLKKADYLLEQRRILAQRYNYALEGISNLKLPRDTRGHAWHLYIVRTAGSAARDNLAVQLNREGIGSSVHFIPLHRMTYWKTEYNLEASDFPAAENLFHRSLSLPLWPGLRWKEQKRIIAVIRETLRGNRHG